MGIIVPRYPSNSLVYVSYRVVPVVNRLARKPLTSYQHLFVYNLDLAHMAIRITNMVVVDHEVAPPAGGRLLDVTVLERWFGLGLRLGLGWGVSVQ